MRLIDADALIEVQMYDEEHEEWSVETMTVEECLARFADVPTIEMEIVRCIDCRWGRETCGNIECGYDATRLEYHGYDWYCPNGKGRTNGD